MTIAVPRGFLFAGLHAGIKQDATREDISLVVSQTPCAAAGVYTQNRVVAAPVLIDRERTPASQIRAIVSNSGNANACTGERGLSDARRMASMVAELVEVSPTDVLVLSTGIIGEHLPMSIVEEGIRKAATMLSSSSDAVTASARGLMTTDTRPKLVSQSIDHSSGAYCVLGMAKGAAMIGPNMATMLGVILTDAALQPDDAQRLLRNAVEDSFNCISVEGHTSTNDTVLLLANGAASARPLEGEDLAEFSSVVHSVCQALATMIADDGEGATHLIEIEVAGCPSRDQAKQVARSIANSPLVKTAVAGADPNWGRIISAAGYAEVPFDPNDIELSVNDVPLFRDGSPVPFDETAVSASIRQNRTTRIRLHLGNGDRSARFWTCDLTTEYVHLNADYHT